MASFLDTRSISGNGKTIMNGAMTTGTWEMLSGSIPRIPTLLSKAWMEEENIRSRLQHSRLMMDRYQTGKQYLLVNKKLIIHCIISEQESIYIFMHINWSAYFNIIIYIRILYWKHTSFRYVMSTKKIHPRLIHFSNLSRNNSPTTLHQVTRILVQFNHSLNHSTSFANQCLLPSKLKRNS